MPDTTAFYIVGAWYDANNNNQWDATNANSFTGNPASEFIRLPQNNLSDFYGLVYTNSVVKYFYNGALRGFPGYPYVLDAYNPLSNMNFIVYPIDDTIYSTFKFYITATNY